MNRGEVGQEDLGGQHCSKALNARRETGEQQQQKSKTQGQPKKELQSNLAALFCSR